MSSCSVRAGDAEASLLEILACMTPERGVFCRSTDGLSACRTSGPETAFEETTVAFPPRRLLTRIAQHCGVSRDLSVPQLTLPLQSGSSRKDWSQWAH